MTQIILMMCREKRLILESRLGVDSDNQFVLIAIGTRYIK